MQISEIVCTRERAPVTGKAHVRQIPYEQILSVPSWSVKGLHRPSMS